MLLVSLMGFPHFLLMRGQKGLCVLRPFSLMPILGINKRPLNPSFDFSLNGQRIRT
jgi:hypothetical protein